MKTPIETSGGAQDASVFASKDGLGENVVNFLKQRHQSEQKMEQARCQTCGQFGVLTTDPMFIGGVMEQATTGGLIDLCAWCDKPTITVKYPRLRISPNDQAEARTR